MALLTEKVTESGTSEWPPVRCQKGVLDITLTDSRNNCQSDEDHQL